MDSIDRVYGRYAQNYEEGEDEEAKGHSKGRARRGDTGVGGTTYETNR